MIKGIKYTTVIIFFVIIISGCTSEKKKWENTKQKNTTFAYEDYLNRYPKGLYSDSAKIHLENLYFQDALSADTIPLFVAFINKYPRSPYSDSAQALLEKLYFKQVQYADTIPAYEDFLKKHPQSVFADSAQILLEKLYYRQAQKINTTNAFQNFIKKYPKSSFVKKARLSIKKLTITRDQSIQCKKSDIGPTRVISEFREDLAGLYIYGYWRFEVNSDKKHKFTFDDITLLLQEGTKSHDEYLVGVSINSGSGIVSLCAPLKIFSLSLKYNSRDMIEIVGISSGRSDFKYGNPSKVTEGCLRFFSSSSHSDFYYGGILDRQAGSIEFEMIENATLDVLVLTSGLKPMHIESFYLKGHKAVGSN